MNIKLFKLLSNLATFGKKILTLAVLQRLGGGYAKTDKQLNTVPACSYGTRNLYPVANFCISLSISKDLFSAIGNCHSTMKALTTFSFEKRKLREQF